MAGKRSKSKSHGRKRSSKSAEGGKRRRRRRSSKSKSSSGGFYRVDAAGFRCPPYADTTSPFGAPCSWATRQPGVPRAFRSLFPPVRVSGQYQAALNAANPASLYQLRNMGVSGRDARAITQLRALQAGQGSYAEYQLGRALQKNRGARQAALYGLDPMAAMAMSGRGGMNPYMMMYGMGK